MDDQFMFPIMRQVDILPRGIRISSSGVIDSVIDTDDGVAHSFNLYESYSLAVLPVIALLATAGTVVYFACKLYRRRSRQRYRLMKTRPPARRKIITELP